MTNINMDLFYDKVSSLLDVVCDTQTDNIKKTAQICADSIKNNGVIQVFGSGHSIGFGQEMENRIGSLVPVHVIATHDFVLNGKVSLEEFKDPTTPFERKSGMAGKLYDLYDISKEDVFIIISNSGINGIGIDLAIKAKEEGHKVIVVTSWQHTNAEDSRHPSGKKLYEMGDVVIDNCGPQGDALLETGDPEKICSVSSITGAFIAQTIATETIAILLKEKQELPVLTESKEHNDKLKERYKGRI